MITVVRTLKWFLLLIGLAWAFYAGNAFFFLARAFPSARSTQYSLTEFLATLQGYAVVFGPFLLALIFLLIKWPERILGRNESTSHHRCRNSGIPGT